MGLLLCIETATGICSVALGKDGILISQKESQEINAHSSQLTVLISKVFEDSGYTLSDLDAVGISMGPGSYTGLRIGVSTAKGLCYGLEKPLIAVSTLQAMAYGISIQCDVPGNSLFCPMIDARRMEVFTALYDSAGNTVLSPVAEIIDASSFSEYRGKQLIVCAGDGATKCKPVFQNTADFLFPEVIVPSSRYMLPVAEQAFHEHHFEDVAYFEPYYLKDFIAGKPKVKGLRDEK